MEKEVKKESKKGIELKVKLIHPNKRFQLGRHTLTNVYQSFELNEAEKKELESAGCKKWVDVKN